MMIQDRYKKILDSLKKKKSVNSKVLVKSLGVSFETVRRDLAFLEREGHLQRVHGGAVLKKIDAREVFFNVRAKSHTHEKKAIAEKALGLIKPNAVVALDHSTTTLELAQYMCGRIENITVVTYSTRVAEILKNEPNVRIIVLGGVLDPKDGSLKGKMVEDYLDLFHIDMSFVGVSGISLIEGATDFELDMISIIRKLLSKSSQKILMADSSKFGKVSLQRICGLEEVDFIITDPELSCDVKELFIHNKIHILN